MSDPEYTGEEPVVLALDTASSTTSIAIVGRGPSPAVASLELSESRSERLWTEIGALLARAGITIHDVSLFGVCVGPGAFTGIRVGLAAVKGLAFATRKPVAGVTSLEAAALSGKGSLPVLALTGAYSGEVYSQLFDWDDQLPVAREGPRVSPVGEALEAVSGLDSLVFAGDAVRAHMDSISSTAGRRFQGEWRGGSEPGWWVAPFDDARRALLVAELAISLARLGMSEDADGVAAVYVRPSEAEVKLSKGLLGSRIRRTLGRA